MSGVDDNATRGIGSHFTFVIHSQTSGPIVSASSFASVEDTHAVRQTLNLNLTHTSPPGLTLVIDQDTASPRPVTPVVRGLGLETHMSSPLCPLVMTQ